MTNREIATLALKTARAVRNRMLKADRPFDAAGEDIIREYVQIGLQNHWQRGEEITFDSYMQLAKEILKWRNHETKTVGEVELAMNVICLKFKEFVEVYQRGRDAESARIAELLPAIKV